MKFHQYTYKKLSIIEQTLYKKMYDAAKRYDAYVLCSENEYTSERVCLVLKSIIHDHPDLFYLHPDKITIEGTQWGIDKLCFSYLYDKDEKTELEEQIQYSTEQYLEQADGMDQGEIVKEIHDLLIENTAVSRYTDEYQMGDWSICGPLLEERSSSVGMAFAFKYLLEQAGVDSQIAYEELEEAPEQQFQVWNIVKMYGKECYFNLCEDALHSSENAICYDYFGLSKEQLEKAISYEKSKKTEEEAIDIEQEETEQELETILLSMKKIPRVYLSKELKTEVQAQVDILENMSSLMEQYEAEELLSEMLKEYLWKEIELLEEYCRYKKHKASPIFMEIPYKKLMQYVYLCKTEMERVLEIFWKQKSQEMNSSLDQYNNGLAEEKMKRRRAFPFTSEQLEDEHDIDVFLAVYTLWTEYGLPKAVQEEIYGILDSLHKVKELVKEDEEQMTEITDLLNIYVPQSVDSLIQLDDFCMLGYKSKKLKDFEKDIVVSLHHIKEAIDHQYCNIYDFKLIDGIAGAKTIAHMIEQEGYTK